jgi:hypothetical protein
MLCTQESPHFPWPREDPTDKLLDELLPGKEWVATLNHLSVAFEGRIPE